MARSPASLIVAVLVICFSLILHPQAAAQPQRVVSINACTDQLLWALADRDQIAALSLHAANPSFFTESEAVRASGVPLIRGSAEEVLKLKPDLVMAGLFTRRATREFLERHGTRVATFGTPANVDGVRKLIAEAGALLGHPERAARIISEIDAAAARLEAVARKGKFSALEIQKRGFTSGSDTLLGDLIERAGLSNAAEKLGIRSVSRVSLETILKLEPDFLVLSQAHPDPKDQGSALILHPALMERYPPSRRLVIPESLILCGGPSVAQAFDRMAEIIKALPAESEKPAGTRRGAG